MLDHALQFLEDFGVIGLFIATAIEASSLPFPGALFVLIFGYVMEVTTWQLVLISFCNSIVFTVFSLIPFGIGFQLGEISKRKANSHKIEKAQIWFRKYGDWSISLSRPLSIGNYISYISGVSRVAIWRFMLFTFIGVFPWNTLLLLIGHHSSSLARIEEILSFLQRFGYYVAAVVIVGVLVVLYIQRRKRHKKSLSKKSISEQ